MRALAFNLSASSSFFATATAAAAFAIWLVMGGAFALEDVAAS
jgi:hypothetical protein